MSESLNPTSFLESLRNKEMHIIHSWNDPVGRTHQKYSRAFDWIEEPLNGIEKELETIKKHLEKSYDETAAENHIRSLKEALIHIEETIDNV